MFEQFRLPKLQISAESGHVETWLEKNWPLLKTLSSLTIYNAITSQVQAKIHCNTYKPSWLLACNDEGISEFSWWNRCFSEEVLRGKWKTNQINTIQFKCTDHDWSMQNRIRVLGFSSDKQMLHVVDKWTILSLQQSQNIMPKWQRKTLVKPESPLVVQMLLASTLVPWNYITHTSQVWREKMPENIFHDIYCKNQWKKK